MVDRLSQTARDHALSGQLESWSFDSQRNAIVRIFSFKDFSEAFAFMTRIALLAETQDHHPEWSNVYNRVEIALTTHDAGGVSERDIMLASAIDALLP
jgi:4a-hydroxytetrahydrobiopterin dehydratase